MKSFKIFYESLQRYSLPSDIKILFFDFYVLSYIASLNLNSKSKEYAGSFFGDEVEIITQIKEAETKVLSSLKQKMLKGIFVGIARELSYATQKRIFAGKHADALRSKNSKKIYELFDNPESVAQFAKLYGKVSFNQIPHALLLIAAQSIFRAPGWSALYGGQAWSQIVEAYVELQHAKTTKDLYIAIDHIFDLQHNNGTVLDKSIEFKDPITGNWDWLDYALNKKANVKNISELLIHASSDMRKLAYKALKSANIYVSRGNIKYDEEMKAKADQILESLIKSSYRVNRPQYINFIHFLAKAAKFLSTHTPGYLPQNIKEYIINNIPTGGKRQMDEVAVYLFHFNDKYQSNAPAHNKKRFIEVEPNIKVCEHAWRWYQYSVGKNK